MKGNKIKISTLMIVLSMVFSLVISSAECYADVEKRDKDKAASQDRSSYKEGELLIKFKDGTSSHRMSSFASESGLKHIESFDSMNIGLYAVKGGKSFNKVIKTLEDKDEIEYVQPNYLYYPTLVPDDYYYDDLWGLDAIDAPEAWDIARGNDVVVAVIDTGIDIRNPELSGSMWENPDEIPGNGIDDDGNGYVDDIYGWDFYNNDNSVFDDEVDDIHGTHVAGIIAAEANEEGVIGVAPNAKIMALKFLGPGGLGCTDDAIEAIEYAKEMGADIINASWGGSPEGEHNDRILRETIETSGLLFVTAAGNDGYNIDTTPFYPASYNNRNILTVANINSGSDLVSSSNFGRVSVDVGAPGYNILSTVTDAVYGIAAVRASGIGAANTGNAFVGAFGLEGLESYEDAYDLLSRAMNGISPDAEVLLVDDDGSNGDYDFYDLYSTALYDSEYENVEPVNVASDISNGPNLSKMLENDVVLWFTGYSYGEGSSAPDRITTLTIADQENLMDYLDAGGTLILFGEGALYDIEESTLVSGYFGIEIPLSDYGKNRHIRGVAGTVFEDLNFVIPLWNNDYWDHLEITGEKTEAMLYYPERDGSIDYMSGTSMAAPHVTGIAALMLDKNPDLTASELKQFIMSNGTDLPSLSGKTVTGKMVNAFNTLKAVPPAKPTGLTASKSGSNITLTWQGREAGDFKEYIVERKIDSGSYSEISRTTSKSYTDSGIDTSKTYRYRVAAVAAGEGYSKTSLYSNVAAGNTGSSGGTPSGGGGKKGSGGGGGGGGGGNTPIPPNPSIDSKISVALKDAKTGANIEIPVVRIDGIDSASMSAKTIDELSKAGKSLTLTGSGAEISIPSSALLTEEVKKLIGDNTAKLSINVKEITGKELQEFEGNTSTGIFRVGDRVFEFTAELKTSKNTINISKFVEELKISIKLSEEEIKGIDVSKLGVYWYNDEKKTWEYAGGVFNPKDNTITFDTGHFSKYAVMRADSTYTDIGRHWAKPEIELMAAKHIIEAAANREFGPDVNITRAEIVKMLVNVLRYDPDKNIELITPATASFKDVSTGNPYFSYIETAAKYGITKGNPDGTFGPDDTVTREQLTTMIIRAMGIKADSDMSILTFEDKDNIPDWAAESIIAAYERGLVMGIGGNKFGVGSTATRAQAVVIIKRVMENFGLITAPEKLTGKLSINDIEGQHYELETAEGIYVLIHDKDSKYLAKLLAGSVGKEIEVTGYVQSGFSIYQRGKLFKVISVELK